MNMPVSGIPGRDGPVMPGIFQSRIDRLEARLLLIGIWADDARARTVAECSARKLESHVIVTYDLSELHWIHGDFPNVSGQGNSVESC
jgi:hypothetical protein